MNKQRKDFEAYILETKVPLLIAKMGGKLSVESARNIIEATWLPHHPEDGEFKAQGTLDLFEMWKAAQACVVVELPEITESNINFALNCHLEDPSDDEESGFFAGVRWCKSFIKQQLGKANVAVKE